MEALAAHRPCRPRGRAGRARCPTATSACSKWRWGWRSKPRLLILDEPTQGLSDGEIDGFIALVREIAESATVLLIEHNMQVVMQLADRITVMNAGTHPRRGHAGRRSAPTPPCRHAYLGTPADE